MMPQPGTPQISCRSSRAFEIVGDGFGLRGPFGYAAGSFNDGAHRRARAAQRGYKPRTICRSPGHARALNISRGSVYYLRRPVSAAIMRRIRIAFDYPFAGGRNGARPAGRRGLGSAGSMRHANEADGHRGALIASPTPRSPRRVTRLTRMCCATPSEKRVPG
jgi:hypothetical protein